MSQKQNTKKKNKIFNLRFLIIFVIISIAYISYKDKNIEHYSFQGKTMGTTYTVNYWSNDNIKPEKLINNVNKRLKEINKSASTWDKNSIISNFNRHNSLVSYNADNFMIKMVNLAQSICHKTGGALDITIAPLIDLWGFDAKGQIIKMPTQDSLNGVKQFIGCDKIVINKDNNSIKKTNPAVRINLSSTAKGGGVDEIGYVLESYNIENYLVEIGGEVRARGKRVDNQSWKIGIETPDSIYGDVKKVIELNDMSIATSGDYRNYFQEDGIRYSHIINPKTGKPITHKLASVSVISKNTADADAWATAFYVLGAEKALEIATKEKLGVMMLVREGDNFKVITSPEWIKAYNK